MGEFEASGLTRSEFSRRRGIAVNTLDSWRARAKPQRLVEVTVQEEAKREHFHLCLRNGRRIESGWNFTEAALARLIRVAESA